MNDEPRRDERTYWSASSGSGGRVVDIDPIEIEPLRPIGKRRAFVPPRELIDRPSPADVEEPIQRVGGRRRFRPEVALIVIGAVFVVGALVKPWPNPILHAGSPSPIATSAPSVMIAAVPAPVGHPEIPPWNYRDPFLGGSVTATPPDVQVGIPGDLTQAWSGVDWSVLGSADPHIGWGIAAAVMPDVADPLVDSAASAPETSWTAAAGSSPTTATVPIVLGRSVYAVAVTWPVGLKVTSVTFVYLGGPDHPPYLPPAGFPPFTQISPIPAASVASPAVGPSAGPSGGAPAARAGGLRSGEFWIPPSAASWNPAATSVPQAWQYLPWAWPDGTYRVTVTSQSGPTTLELHLQQVVT